MGHKKTPFLLKKCEFLQKKADLGGFVYTELKFGQKKAGYTRFILIYSFMQLLLQHLEYPSFCFDRELDIVYEQYYGLFQHHQD